MPSFKCSIHLFAKSRNSQMAYNRHPMLLTCLLAASLFSTALGVDMSTMARLGRKASLVSFAPSSPRKKELAEARGGEGQKKKTPDKLCVPQNIFALDFFCPSCLFRYFTTRQARTNNHGRRETQSKLERAFLRQTAPAILLFFAHHKAVLSLDSWHFRTEQEITSRLS